MQTDTNPAGGIDLATIPDFQREYAKLEGLVVGGTATPVERLVYLVATLAVHSAREAAELYRMIEQQRAVCKLVYVSAHFPMPYRRHFLYAGRLFDLFMDALPPCSGKATS